MDIRSVYYFMKDTIHTYTRTKIVFFLSPHTKKNKTPTGPSTDLFLFHHIDPLSSRPAA